MTNDLIERLREVGGMSDDGATRWYINPDGPEAASRIEKLEAALRQCEIIAEQYQKENEFRAEITNGTTTKAKARAVAARCGMLLGSQRKVIRNALEGKDD